MKIQLNTLAWCLIMQPDSVRMRKLVALDMRAIVE